MLKCYSDTIPFTVNKTIIGEIYRLKSMLEKHDHNYLCSTDSKYYRNSDNPIKLDCLCDKVTKGVTVMLG